MMKSFLFSSKFCQNYVEGLDKERNRWLKNDQLLINFEQKDRSTLS